MEDHAEPRPPLPGQGGFWRAERFVQRIRSAVGRVYSRAKQLRTLLIVSDDNGFRKQLSTVFDPASGFDTCVQADSGMEALAKIRELSPALVVLDFLLPDMTGLQLARMLKSTTPELPIFMLTMDYNVDIEKDARSCGITAVFSKLDDLAPLAANARVVCGIE